MKPRKIEQRNKTETKRKIFAFILKTITCLFRPYITPCVAGLGLGKEQEKKKRTKTEIKQQKTKRNE